MSTESTSSKENTQQHSPASRPSSSPQTPLTSHLLQVMDSKPVPADVLGEIRQQADKLPDTMTWHQLKQWFHTNRPAGAWTMARVFDAQKAHHAQYLDIALAEWSEANSVHTDIPPRGTSSKKLAEMESKSSGGTSGT